MKENATFVKLISGIKIKELVKEAKRVKYLVEKDAYTVTVRDDETNDLVFKAAKMNSHTWLATFSKIYWQDTSLDNSAK